MPATSVRMRGVMGVAIYPEIEGSSDGWPDDINGKFLARALEHLDKAAKAAKVQPLMAFHSMTHEQMAAEGIEDAAELWFDPLEGLKTVRALLEYIRRDSEQINASDEVQGDLEATERYLSVAVESGKGWHLVLDA